MLMITPETLGCYQNKPDKKPGMGFWGPFVRWYVNCKLGCPSGANYVAFLTDHNSHRDALHAKKLFEGHPPEGHSPVKVQVGKLSKMVYHPASGGLFEKEERKYEKKAIARAMIDPIGIPTVRWSDDASFWQYGYKAFAITDTAHLRYKHYHETTDCPKELNFEAMTKVVEGMIGMIEDLADEHQRP